MSSILLPVTHKSCKSVEATLEAHPETDRSSIEESHVKTGKDHEKHNRAYHVVTHINLCGRHGSYASSLLVTSRPSDIAGPGIQR